MKRKNVAPRQRAIAAAIAGALTGLAPLVAKADCGVNGTISANTTEIGWSSGNCTIAPGVVLSNFNTATALLATGSSLGTLTNNGTIAGITYGVVNSGTISVLNNNSGGQLVGGSAGIRNTGSINTFNNDSLVSTTGIAGTIAAGINSSGTIGTLTNTATGTITGAGRGILNTGTIGIVNNMGLLAGSGTVSGSIFGIDNSTGGSIGTILNSGTIKGSTYTGTIVGYGILGENSSTIGTLNNSGTITNELGILVRSGATLGTLTNSGSIVGTFSGVVAQSGTIGTIDNTGLISGATTQTVTGFPSGPYTGIFALAGATIGSVINSGTITGLFYAINIDSTSTIGQISNSGLIAGNIRNSGSVDLSISGGSGAVFGTLTGLSGGIGSTAEGTITNTSSNVVFGSGNLLLNDKVNVGSHAVNNTGATLQVNNPISITGNYTQGASATLLVGVADGAVAGGSIGSDSGYGRLVVSGTANIAAGSAVTLQKLNAYGFAAGQRFVVVDAAGTGTNYNESTLRYSIAGASGLVVTGAAVANGANSDLVLTVANPTTTTSMPTGATAPNAVSALTGLANYTGISPDLLNLYNASLALDASGSTQALNAAGKQLSPTSPASSSRAAAAPTFDVLNIISSHANGLRLAQNGGSGISTGEAPPTWGVWGQAFGGHASQDERDQVDGYSANYGGLLLGVDRAVSDTWRVGGAFSYSNAAVDNTGDTAGDSTRINSYGLIGYASYVASRWYANLSAGVVAQRYDTHRVINFTGFSGEANGSFSGQQYVARGEIGYPLSLGSATVTPLGSLTYSYLHQDAYTESGGNGAALSVDASHLTSVSTDIGAKIQREVSTSYGVLVPELTLAWRHEYNNQRALTTATFAADPSGQTSFSVLGTSPLRDSAVLSAGFTLLKERNLSLTARYDVQLGPGYLSQAGSLRLRQLF
ncbi:outer membrane autotransporter [Pseudogulbenkiania sp. NH8B]|uniref:autotransporter outer membrane beta-barrel domain-containing protein n=1 Tax=Pseudogulbenkiania sp. (strain NH8B) TaxID=748280 RepID=UPI0002279197|nr:autotransporter domain-containing protein [Pseudogulbenkiania sp. NH8B]BAK75714.1 outer membrane autotransporter [Pseudogulbenkiania sp. NH8B]